MDSTLRNAREPAGKTQTAPKTEAGEEATSANAGNVGALVPFLVSFFDADHDLLAFDDPLPSLGAILWAVEEMLRINGPTETLTSRTPDIGAKIAGLVWGSSK